MAEVTTFSKEFMDKVHGDLAKQVGLTLEQYRARLAAEYKEFWCSCGNPSESSYFHDDGQGTGPSCVQKHHYHCDDCGKITQVG